MNYSEKLFLEMIAFDKEKIKDLCKQNGILKLYLVGSSSRNDHDEFSDIDLLVKFESSKTPLEQYFNAKDDFVKLFKKKVDLIEEGAVKNPIILKNIERDKILIYES